MRLVSKTTGETKILVFMDKVDMNNRLAYSLRKLREQENAEKIYLFNGYNGYFLFPEYQETIKNIAQVSNVKEVRLRAETSFFPPNKRELNVYLGFRGRSNPESLLYGHREIYALFLSDFIECWLIVSKHLNVTSSETKNIFNLYS